MLNNNVIRQIVLVLVLAAALGYAVFTYWPVLAPLAHLPARKPPAVPVPAASAPVPAPSISPTVEAAAKKAQELVMELPTAEARLTDPFALRIQVRTQAEEPVSTTLPGRPAAAKPAEPELQGIWLDSGMEIAFISDQSVQRGGLIMGWRLESIAPDHVVLTKGGATKTLYLK